MEWLKDPINKEETAMTTQEIIALAKEKLGKDITEEEALDYLDGKIPIPDEALELVSGGGSICKSLDKKYGPQIICPLCGSKAYESKNRDWLYTCNVCSTNYYDASEYMIPKWYVYKYCPQCHARSEYEVSDLRSFKYRCNNCGYHS